MRLRSIKKPQVHGCNDGTSILQHDVHAIADDGGLASALGDHVVKHAVVRAASNSGSANRDSAWCCDAVALRSGTSRKNHGKCRMYGGAEVGEKNSFGLHNSFLRTSRQVTFGITHQIAQGFPGEWRYGVVVITLDSESSNPSSNLGSASFPFCVCHHLWWALRASCLLATTFTRQVLPACPGERAPQISLTAAHWHVGSCTVVAAHTHVHMASCPIRAPV